MYVYLRLLEVVYGSCSTFILKDGVFCFSLVVAIVDRSS